MGIGQCGQHLAADRRQPHAALGALGHGATDKRLGAAGMIMPWLGEHRPAFVVSTVTVRRGHAGYVAPAMPLRQKA